MPKAKSKAMKFVDIDGHILEPTDLWEKYIEPRYRDKAIKIETDKEGLEYLSVAGQPSWFFQGGTLGAITAIGKDVHPFLEPGKVTYAESMVPGGYDPHERIKVMDAEGIDMTLVYPSLGLGWESDCRDPLVAAANCRAYNNWVFDFCQPYPERLIAVAHVPTSDVQEGIKELKRSAKLGARAAMVSSNPTNPRRVPYGDAYYDPLWAEAQDLDIPITIHPTGGGNSMFTTLYPRREDITTWWVFLCAADEVKLQFSTMFNGGTLERFPSLKVVVLESNVGWIVPWLDRMDDKFEINGFTTKMRIKPTEYFQRQCSISMDPDERLAPFSIQTLGADSFMWAYDFPHSDSVLDPVKKLRENLASLPKEAQRKVAGENAIKLYHL